MDENKPPHRMKGVTVCLPIAYGSIAWNMTKKSEQEQCTHQWSLYVRSPHGHDLGTVLKKAVFTLHPSFINHIRDVATHPFEVTEKGWGEFEALVDLHFKDAHEKPVELRHQVKLFHGKDGPTTQSSNKKPVVHEYYDEVVFTDPTEEFYQCLQHLGETKTHRHTLQDLFPLYSDVEDIRRIQAAHEFITDQLRTAKDKLLRVESEAKTTLEEKKKAAAPPVAAPAPAPPAPVSAPAPAQAPAPPASTAAAPTPAQAAPTSAAPPTAAPVPANATTTGAAAPPQASPAPPSAVPPPPGSGAPK